MGSGGTRALWPANPALLYLFSLYTFSFLFCCLLEKRSFGDIELHKPSVLVFLSVFSSISAGLMVRKKLPWLKTHIIFNGFFASKVRLCSFLGLEQQSCYHLYGKRGECVLGHSLHLWKLLGQHKRPRFCRQISCGRLFAFDRQPHIRDELRTRGSLGLSIFDLAKG